MGKDGLAEPRRCERRNRRGGGKSAMTNCADNTNPGSRWDYALLSTAAVASLPFIAANAVIIRHRKRSFFRAQGGASLILTSSIAGLFWILAVFIINFHVPRSHGFLRNCPFWSFWLQLTFGFWLWISCQIVRFLHLYRLCLTAASSAPSKYWILVCGLALWTPGLVIAVIATTSHASVPVQKSPLCFNCELEMVWKFYIYVIPPSVYITILVVSLYHSRNIKDYMMTIEYSHTSDYSFSMVFVFYILFGSIVLLRSQRKVPGRCILTFCTCFIVFVNFWVRLGRPVYLCLFKSESEMDKFEEELRSCGAECLDKLSSSAGASQATRTSSSLQYSDWVLRAISAARTEASECKERINHLQQRKLMLSARIKHLEESGSLHYTSSPSSVRRL